MYGLEMMLIGVLMKQIFDYALGMQDYIYYSLDQVDTGYQEREVYLNEEEQGSESVAFKAYFSEELSYINTEWTPQCSSYLIPKLNEYIVEHDIYPGFLTTEEIVNDVTATKKELMDLFHSGYFE